MGDGLPLESLTPQIQRNQARTLFLGVWAFCCIFYLEISASCGIFHLTTHRTQQNGEGQVQSTMKSHLKVSEKSPHVKKESLRRVERKLKRFVPLLVINNSVQPKRAA